MGEDKIRKDSADAAAIYNSYYYLYARGIYTTFFLYSYCRIYVFHRTYLYVELYIEKKTQQKYYVCRSHEDINYKSLIYQLNNSILIGKHILKIICLIKLP